MVRDTGLQFHFLLYCKSRLLASRIVKEVCSYHFNDLEPPIVSKILFENNKGLSSSKLSPIYYKIFLIYELNYPAENS